MDLHDAKQRMLDRHLRDRGIHDARVLEAMAAVPRERFVSGSHELEAYADRPLPIGSGQTISQPYIVAFMAQEARVGETARVLEVGTGSGYGAAVLGELAREVHSIERHPELARLAESVLIEAGCDNVTVHVGDGSAGLPRYGPFDAIVVTAASPRVPQPLLDQLTVGGRLVIPVEHVRGHQQLTVVERRGADDYEEHAVLGVAFVPLIGEHAHPES